MAQGKGLDLLTLKNDLKGGFMAIVKINFDIEVPDNMDEDDMGEWLRYRFGDNGFMSLKNPLAETRDPDPIFGTFEWDYRE